MQIHQSTIDAPPEGEGERLGRKQIRVVALCALLLAFDGYDISSIAFAIPSLLKAWGVAPGAFTPAIVSGSVGMLIGALVSGALGDRFGRRPVFIGCVLTFGVFSLSSSLCTNIDELAVSRFLTGIGLGGGVPIAVALASDYSPRRLQAALVSVMSTGVPLGIVLGGNIAGALIPSYGWKAVFVFGGVVPVLLVPVLLLWLPESPHFRDRDTTLPKVRGQNIFSPVRQLFKNGFGTVSILLWVCFAMNLLAHYMVLLWLPAILHAAGGSASQSVFGATLFALAGIVGVIGMAKPIGRFGAERVLAVSLLVGAAATFVGGTMALPYGVLLVVVFCMGLGLSGSQMGMNALAGSAYPAAIRSTGAGWALGVGRLGNIFGPLLGGVLLLWGYQAQSIFLAATLPIVIAAIAMTMLGIVRGRARHRASTMEADALRSRPVARPAD